MVEWSGGRFGETMFLGREEGMESPRMREKSGFL